MVYQVDIGMEVKYWVYFIIEWRRLCRETIIYKTYFGPWNTDESKIQIILHFLEALQELRFRIESKIYSLYMLEGVKDEMGTVTWTFIYSEYRQNT
jgi:hypothetical protein